MKRLGVIVKREFSTRVRKRSFILLTLLAPIFMGAILILPGYLATMPSEKQLITVLDEAFLLNFHQGEGGVKFRYLPPEKFSPKEALDFSQEAGDYAFLHIPLSEGGDPDFLARNARLMRQGEVSIKVESAVEDVLERYIQEEKLKFHQINPEIVAQTKTNVNIRIIDLESGNDATNASLVKMGLGYLSAFAIYIFIFMYGSWVMRGVIEEKSNRIVEILVSTVKPIELMLGKLLGIGAVALLQFVIWVVLIGGLYFLASQLFLSDLLEVPTSANPALSSGETELLGIYKSLSSINFLSLLTAFLFYFTFGYLMYAAIFAAIGSAVDQESDSSQYMMPVSLPLIAALIVIFRTLDSPDGSIAFWFSIFPLTSPLVMMARIPFGVPFWELLLSITLLVLTFFVLTWGAAKIYRTGILMYGKKATFKEILKWIRYSP